MSELLRNRRQFIPMIGSGLEYVVRSVVGSGVEPVLAAAALFGYQIVGPRVQANPEGGRSSSNRNLAVQLGLTSPQSLRPVLATYRKRSERVFADGTVLIDQSAILPTVRVAWSYRGSIIKPEPFPFNLVTFGPTDDDSRRTIQFNLRYADKELATLLRDISSTNPATRDEALKTLQNYCSNIRLGLRTGEQRVIDQFLNRI